MVGSTAATVVAESSAAGPAAAGSAAEKVIALVTILNYPKFCIGFKIRKSRSEQLLLSGSGHSK